MNGKHVAVASGVAAAALVLSASAASSTTVINGQYSCTAAFPSHAQTIFGTQPHNHTMVLGMTTKVSAGTFQTSTKTIWPTGIANRLSNGGASTASHVGNNSGGNGAGSSVYCRNSNNA
jgi:predicted phage gp36 major capsid-like protein